MENKETFKAIAEEAEWMDAHPRRCKDCKHLRIFHSRIFENFDQEARQTTLYKCDINTCKCTEFESKD